MMHWKELAGNGDNDEIARGLTRTSNGRRLSKRTQL